MNPEEKEELFDEEVPEKIPDTVELFEDDDLGEVIIPAPGDVLDDDLEDDDDDDEDDDDLEDDDDEDDDDLEDDEEEYLDFDSFEDVDE